MSLQLPTLSRRLVFSSAIPLVGPFVFMKLYYETDKQILATFNVLSQVGPLIDSYRAKLLGTLSQTKVDKQAKEYLATNTKSAFYDPFNRTLQEILLKKSEITHYSQIEGWYYQKKAVLIKTQTWSIVNLLALSLLFPAFSLSMLALALSTSVFLGALLFHVKQDLINHEVSKEIRKRDKTINKLKAQKLIHKTRLAILSEKIQIIFGKAASPTSAEQEKVHLAMPQQKVQVGIGEATRSPFNEGKIEVAISHDESLENSFLQKIKIGIGSANDKLYLRSSSPPKTKFEYTTDQIESLRENIEVEIGRLNFQIEILKMGPFNKIKPRFLSAIPAGF